MAIEPKVQTQETLSVYPAEDLADNARIFGASRSLVEVALRLAGKTQATVSEAKTIIEKFRSKEVR